MHAMAKGWTVEVTSEYESLRGPKLRLQLFDVAIEDKMTALEAVRHQARTNMIVQIIAKEQLAANAALSPGRVRAR
jgi:hypothetical protein